MACFGGGGGGGSGAKAALNVAADPQIASKAFLEVKLTLGNANSRESTLLLNRAGEYLPGAPDAAGASRPPKQPKLPAANDDEQNIQNAIKAIQVSKNAIESHKKDIDKIKATISVYNELYVQTSMEYYALANSVGVQLESSRDNASEAISSHPSSGFISARRRHHEQL